MTNHPPSVLWHCWLGHQTCKNRRPYNLYCVGADVKPCSIQSWTRCIIGTLVWWAWRHSRVKSVPVGLGHGSKNPTFFHL